jgi:hypothetical protein
MKKARRKFFRRTGGKTEAPGFYHSALSRRIKAGNRFSEGIHIRFSIENVILFRIRIFFA